MRHSTLANYASFAEAIVDPPRLSLRNGRVDDLDAWRTRARERVGELLLAPPRPAAPVVESLERWSEGGIDLERLRWRLPYGPPTEAVCLRPSSAAGPLPGVLVLHDHGGQKFFGWRKLLRLRGDEQPVVDEHLAQYYGDRDYPRHLAERGYAVLVHDCFAFGSRRALPSTAHEQVAGEVSDGDGGDPDSIRAYNRWAGEYEHVLAKALFSAGLSWPGVFVTDDICALDVLAAREGVDAQRLACCGLSGGGLRTAFLAGMDERIRACVCVGFMTTWRDFADQVAQRHTWMSYLPGLPRELDFPELLALRAPAPTMVLNTRADALFSIDEAERAFAILREVFVAAGASDALACEFFDGPHKFDVPMQDRAFDWLSEALQY